MNGLMVYIEVVPDLQSFRFYDGVKVICIQETVLLILIFSWASDMWYDTRDSGQRQ